MRIRFLTVFTFLILLAASSCAYFRAETEELNFEKPAANAETQTETISEDAAPEISPDASEPDGIYIIFDASGSMWGRLKNDSRKIDVAKNVLNDFVGGDFAGFDLALRAYGHRHKEDCADTELVVPFGEAAQTILPMREFVGKINPLGRTPITRSLQEALKDFGSRSGEIILISDGIESCNADPCALIREWRKRNVKINVHVVGFGVNEKSRDALKCLSEAAGTVYHDAQTAESLAEALKKIREKAASNGFVLRGFDENENRVRVIGTLSRGGNVAYKISSNGRFRVEAGEYELNAGVQTVNGNIYKPATKTVRIAETGETVAEVKVPLPPRVRAKFRDTLDVEQSGSLVYIRQNKKQIAKFRPQDEVFIDEGNFEFVVNPRNTGEISVSETFAAGDRKEILFELEREVRVLIKLRASGSDKIMPGNPELWQNGKMVYKINRNSGRIIRPGTYDVRLPDALTPFEKKNVIIGNKAEQIFEIDVPVGFVTFIYQKSDGSPDTPARVFVSRASENQKIYKRGNSPIPLTPGKYKVDGWTQKGRYETVFFTVAAGETKQIALRAK